MASDGDSILLHIDDVCTSKSSNETAVGFIERTHSEVSSHEPDPAHTYGRIDRHPLTPRKLFKEFLRTGVPPPDHVLMQWQTENKVELLPCSDLVLLNRSFVSGDLVRQGSRSGTVISSRTSCTLLSMCDVRDVRSGVTLKAAWLPVLADQEQPFESAGEGFMLYNIPSSELKRVQTINEGDTVVYKNWVGRVKDCWDEVTVRLGDNGVVAISDEGTLQPPIGEDQEGRFSVGSLVRAAKGMFRRGRWIYGSYSPNTPPVGVAVNVRTNNCEINWLHQRVEKAGLWSSAPDPMLGPDELESDEFRIYDIARMPSPRDSATKTQSRVRSEFPLEGGMRVRFRNLSEAETKYNGTTQHGKLQKLDRTATLGYDLNIFTVTSTVTELDVMWSDKSIETVKATSVIPDPSVDDEDAVMIGEIVCTNETRTPPPEAQTSWAITPARVGIAESVNAKDRIAHVRWFKNSTLSFCDKEMTLFVAGTRVGELGDEVEEVSFYEIRAPSLNRQRGDFVLLLKEPPLSQATGPTSIDWFGEVVDLGMNGKCTVRLGAAEPVQEVECEITDLLSTPALNQDQHDDFGAGVDGDADIMDYGSDEESDFDMEDVEDQFWYEDGQELPIDEMDDSWSTEDEDHDDQSVALPSENPVPAKEPSQLDGTHFEAPVEANGNGNAQTSTTPMPCEEMHLSSLPNAPAPYDMLESEVPSGHKFLLQSGSASSTHMKSVQKEHKILGAPGALPDGVFVRSWESRMDLIRVLFVGPLGTPYEYAPFLVDLHLPPQYPHEPPKAYFHSWEGAGLSGRVNPNLYEDGKICLSLLGTWQGDSNNNEAWTPNQSTVLQVLVSILGLVLVKEPYYNEAGFEPLQEVSSFKNNSAVYTERTYLRARAFLISPLTRLEQEEACSGLEGFENVLRWLYMDGQGAGLLSKAIKACQTILQNSEEGNKVEERDGLTVISRGATLPMKRVLARLEQLAQSGNL